MRTTHRRAFSLLALAPLVVAASCSSDPKKRGQIMIAVSSDMSVPANLEEVVVEILSSDGVVQRREYLLKPQEFGQPMPGTVAIVPPNEGGQQLRVRVIGRRNNGATPEARVLREALVVVPRDRVGLLHMPIRWLCDDDAFREQDEEGNVINKCNANEGETKTCQAGACVDADLTAVELPEYEPAAVYGGGNENGEGGVCFDAPDCFDKGVTVEVGAGCTVPLPSGGEGVSVGLVPSDRSRGICRQGDSVGDCYIPIDRDDQEGWREAGGRIQLPSSLCNGPKASQVSRVVVTTACATKTLGTPICGPWTNVKTVAPVGPQTPPVGGGGDGDGGLSPRDDGGTPLRPDGGVDVLRDGGAGGGGTVVRPDASHGDAGTGTCAQQTIPLPSAATGAMFILLDGSSRMSLTGGAVPTLLQGWLSSASVSTPGLAVGIGLAQDACDSRPSTLMPLMPLAAGFALPAFEFGVGDFPLEEGLNAAQRELEGAPLPASARKALVILSAQGPEACVSGVESELTASLASRGIATHVLSPGPGSSFLSTVATAGGTGGVVTFSDVTGFNSTLDTIAAGLASSCTYVAPPGDPSTVIVSLRGSDLGTVELQYRGDLGCADSPGYIMDPGGDPGLIQLCPATCSQVSAAPGTQVVATLLGRCDTPPVGAGGAGNGGVPGQGGTFGAAGSAVGVGGTAGDPDAGPGQGGIPGTVDAGGPPLRCDPALCPTPPQGAPCCITPDGPCAGDEGFGCGCPALMPSPFEPCPFVGQACTYGEGMCGCSPGEGWQCAVP